MNKASFAFCALASFTATATSNNNFSEQHINSNILLASTENSDKFALPASNQPSTQEIRVVVTEGLGADVMRAAQNAAQNALTQVVGSFMDSTKILEKRSVIQDGVRAESLKIDTNIKEYSQGSIKSFELVDVSNESGLTKVTARVTVKIEDFKTYIKKVAEGSTQIDGDSLFKQSSAVSGKAAAEVKQNQNKKDLLFENVIQPIVDGSVIEFKIGDFVHFESPPPNTIGNMNNSDYTSNRSFYDKIKNLQASFGEENLFQFSVTTYLNADFLQNMYNTLDSISTNKKEFFFDYCNDKINSSPPRCGNHGLGAWGHQDTLPGAGGRDLPFFPINSVKPGDVLVRVNQLSLKKVLLPQEDLLSQRIKSKVYLIDDTNKEKQITESWFWPMFTKSILMQTHHDLIVSLLDENDNLLQEEILDKQRAVARIADLSSRYRWNSHSAASVPWLMIELEKWRDRNVELGGINIYDQRTFTVVIAVEQEALSKAKKLKVRLSD